MRGDITTTKPLLITGNAHKARYIAHLLGVDIDSQSIDVDEIQSKNPEDVIRHKVMQAYGIVKRPVFVDDFSFWFDDLNGLPGPFIKFFVTGDDALEKLCRMADGLASRRVTARAYFGYYDGVKLSLFYGEIKGEIVDHPRGTDRNGIATDFVFAVDGYGGRTRSELSDEEYAEVYNTVRPLDAFREFLREKV